MNSSSTLLILGVVGVVIALLLLAPATTQSPELGPGVPSTSIGAEPISRTVGTPTVNVGPDRTVGERETIELSGTVHVPGGGELAYQWTAEGGLGTFANAHSRTTTYVTPSACGCDDRVLVTLTVTGASGVSVRDSLILSIYDPIACPVESYETGGSFVTVIDPCRADNARAMCPARPVEPCTSPCITDAGSTGGCTEVPIPCPCAVGGCDAQWGGWGADWPFGARPEHPRDRPKPRIDPHYPASIGEGRSTPIRGTISNPACVSVCFTWSASKGWFEGADTLEPVYHAPESDRRGGETVTITLTAYDAAGGRSYDQIRIDILNDDPS